MHLYNHFDEHRAQYEETCCGPGLGHTHALRTEGLSGWEGVQSRRILGHRTRHELAITEPPIIDRHFPNEPQLEIQGAELSEEIKPRPHLHHGVVHMGGAIWLLPKAESALPGGVKTLGLALHHSLLQSTHEGGKCVCIIVFHLKNGSLSSR